MKEQVGDAGQDLHSVEGRCIGKGQVEANQFLLLRHGGCLLENMFVGSIVSYEQLFGQEPRRSTLDS